MERELLTTPQASALSGLSVAYLGSLAKKGVLEGRQYGRDWLIYRDSLERYLTHPRKPGPKGPTGPKKKRRQKEPE
jgi:excisionase family DNA binding protein